MVVVYVGSPRMRRTTGRKHRIRGYNIYNKLDKYHRHIDDISVVCLILEHRSNKNKWQIIKR